VAGVVTFAGLLLLAGCGGDSVHVDGFHVSAAERTPCARVLGDLPSKVAGQSRRTVSGSAYAAAWGDPAIVLRCGVPLPRGYASAPCITRNGIGWSIPLTQADDQGSDVVMTLAHRSLVLQVLLPARYRPNGPSEVMADLAATVTTHTTAQGRCS
jgi:hypothetical protein